MDEILLVGYEDVFFNYLKDALSTEYVVHTCDCEDFTVRMYIEMVDPTLVVYVKPGQVSADEVRGVKEEFPAKPFVVICENNDNSIAAITDLDWICLHKPVKTEILKTIIAKTIRENSQADDRASVLTVDDNGMVLRTVNEIIGNEYKVTFANSGQNALTLLENNIYDLILLDYEMPDMNGHEVFKALMENERTRNIPVIFLTAVADRQRAVEVVNDHPAAYLLKPIDRDMLLSTIKDVLKKMPTK